MTSPVDTSVKYFDSTMPNSPVLSGTVGSLIGLLDACLKDGFNTITPTSIVVASGVATVAWSGTFAAIKDSVVLIAGVTDKTGLNGEQKVVSKGGTSLTFATAESSGTATLSSATMKMASAGWLKPYSGTNLAAYKSNDPATYGMLLRVDDTGTTSARVVGYESMSDVNTGLGAFPTAAQISGGGYWAKSIGANATAVAWALAADSRGFYLHVQAGYSSSSNNQSGVTRYFGDMTPYKSGGDAYACVLNYSAQAAVTSQSDADLASTTTTTQDALPRDYTGLGSGVRFLHSPLCCLIESGAGVQQHSGFSAIAGSFPSPYDGALWLSPLIARSSAATPPRAIFPGIYYAQQSGVFGTFKFGDRTPGAGALEGRNISAVTGIATNVFGTSASTGNTGVMFLDTTGPWR